MKGYLSPWKIFPACMNLSQKNLYVFRGFELGDINGTYNIYYPNNKDVAVKFIE